MQFKHSLLATICLASLTAATPANSAIIGPASGYNVFVFENFTSSNTDTQGNLAAGGNVSLSSYAVASQVSGGAAQLVSGGSVTANNGRVGSDGQGIVYTSSASLSSFTYGGISPQSQVDFSAAETEYQNLSTSWSALASNGTAETSYSTLNLTGSNRSLNVFSIDDTELTGTNSLNISAPTNSTVLINVSGSDQIFQNGNVSLSGIDSSNVIYNFFEATELTLAGSKNPNGSILAAWADVSGGYGAMDGQMIANSFDGHIEFHDTQFVGTVPIPAAFWLFGSAFGLIEVVRRRVRTA